MTMQIDIEALDFAELLRPGERIVWGHACGEPTSLIERLAQQAPRLQDVSAFAGSSFSGLVTSQLAENVAMFSFGAIGVLGNITKEGLLGIIPCHIGQIGPMLMEGLLPCDVAFIQVSPADAQGNHSYGLIADYVQPIVARARLVIAEINDQVPYTFGDAVLPHDKIDIAVSVSRIPTEVAPARVGETELAIAGFVAEYIGDRAVLQVGVGAVPDALLGVLSDRRDLGIHSGMIGDSLIDLVNVGAVTNAHKPRDRGISITGALIGTRRLYDFAHQNPAIGMRSGLYTHSETILSSIPNLVTINSAVEVDLTGQVNAEQTVSGYIGGTGGQVDYVRAGSRSLGGRSIIALPATAARGKISRIVPLLNGPITTARSEVDIIVTEFGAAELKGQTLTERARRLVAIAHPDHREPLAEAAHMLCRRGY